MTTMKSKFCKTLFLPFFLISSFICLFSVSSFAGVNYMNGNFYTSFVDILVPGAGEALEMKRYYNSKSTYMGWFGAGWGTQYETYLEVVSDGSIVINEHGGGGKTLFFPKTGRLDAEADAKKIVDAMKSKVALSEKAYKDMIAKLKKDAESRRAYSVQYGIKVQIAVGSILYSNQRGIQQVHRVAEGFKRIYNDGNYELFNVDGKLLKIVQKSGYSVLLEYEGKTVKTIKDSAAKQLFLSWYPDGRVKEVWSKENIKTQYTYDNKGNLTKSIDVAKNIYVYDYDSNHNMTSITYSDKTKMEMKYSAPDQFIQYLKDRNGKIETYVYEKDKKAPDLHYWTTVTEKLPSGITTINKYEYEHKRKDSGDLFTYRIVTIENNVREETIYDDDCLLPIEMSDGKISTKFKYNQSCLLVEKNSNNGESVKLEYHAKFNKIIRVDGIANGTKYWTKFDYDEQANLSKAENNDGKAVLLVYDRAGQITKMVDGNVQGGGDKKKVNRTLSFRYNAMGKPVEIALDQVGKISVEYDNFGEIKNVQSSGNNQMAFQVTETFNTLLEIVRPAGVDLSL